MPSASVRLLWALLAGAQLAACSISSPEQAPPAELSPSAAATVPAATPSSLTPEQLAERWGVQVLGVTYSAAGYMLDFRYRVTDPEKARPVVDHRIKPYLEHRSTGAKLMVPAPPKVGPLRQTSRGSDPTIGRMYVILFANPNKWVQPGDEVDIVIGDFKAEHLVVR